MRALLHLKAVVAKPGQFLVCGRYGRCVNHKARSLVLACVRNLVDILVVMDEHALFLQLLCQVRRRAVVTCYNRATMYEISCYCAHADAACTDKIDRLDIFQFHFNDIL